MDGLIKAFGKNITKQKKIIGGFIPTHLNLSFPINPVKLLISSDNNKDSFENEGAKIIIINGLDEEYNEINEMINLNGQFGIYSKKYFFRINNIVVVECGNLNNNQGNIFISSSNDILKNGIPDKYLYHIIGINENISCCGIYTVPKNCVFKMYHLNTTAELSFFDKIVVNIHIKPELFTSFEIIELYFNYFNTNMTYHIKGATVFGEKTDVYITAQKTSFFNNPVKFGCYYHFTMYDN